MAAAEPPDNALPLAQAFRLLNDDYAVRLIEAPTGQSRRGRPRWRRNQLLVIAKFFDSRQPGEIWVRLGDPDGPWVQRDSPPPELLRVRPENWHRGIVERLKKRVLQTKRSVTTYGRRDGQPWFPPRQRKTITELVDEVWYDVRIVVAEPLAAPTGAAGTLAERALLKAKARDWVAKIYAPRFRGQRPPSRPVMVKDVRAQFGDDVPTTFILKLKSEYLPGGKGGRPRTKPADKILVGKFKA